MSRINALKKIYAMSRRLSRQRGGGALKYFLDGAYCSYKHGASPENYFVLRFFEMSNAQRELFLTSGRPKAADKALNRNASAEQKAIVGDKSLFNREMKNYVNRDSLFAPDADFEDFSAFLDKHGEFFIKPVSGTMGKGIEKLRSGDVADRRGFFRRCQAERLLLEEPIVQHAELERVCPGCVNTVRINAARRADGSVCLVGACLKCGGDGAVTDNFHSGGIAYPLNIETGIVSGAGRNNTELKDYVNHPASGVYMPAFQVPNFEAVKACVIGAMERLDTLGYVGWDVAVTPAGAELIEGNYNWPGGNIIQFDGVGKYPIIRECLAYDIERDTD